MTEISEADLARVNEAVQELTKVFTERGILPSDAVVAMAWIIAQQARNMASGSSERFESLMFEAVSVLVVAGQRVRQGK